MWCGSATQAGVPLGLVTGHAYSILSDHTVTLSNGKSVDLVRIRNPWGTGEWKGDWGDSSKLWTPDLKVQIPNNELSFGDDGAF